MSAVDDEFSENNQAASGGTDTVTQRDRLLSDSGDFDLQREEVSWNDLVAKGVKQVVTESIRKLEMKLQQLGLDKVEFEKGGTPLRRRDFLFAKMSHAIVAVVGNAPAPVDVETTHKHLQSIMALCDRFRFAVRLMMGNLGEAIQHNDQTDEIAAALEEYAIDPDPALTRPLKKRVETITQEMLAQGMLVCMGRQGHRFTGTDGNREQDVEMVRQAYQDIDDFYACARTAKDHALG